MKNKVLALVLGALTILPTLTLAVTLLLRVSPLRVDFTPLVSIFFLSLPLMFLVMLFYIARILFADGAVEAKVGWAIALFTVFPIAGPLYWYYFLWREGSHDTSTAS